MSLKPFETVVNLMEFMGVLSKAPFKAFFSIETGSNRYTTILFAGVTPESRGAERAFILKHPPYIRSEQPPRQGLELVFDIEGVKSNAAAVIIQHLRTPLIYTPPLIYISVYSPHSDFIHVLFGGADPRIPENRGTLLRYTWKDPEAQPLFAFFRDKFKFGTEYSRLDFVCKF